jgi:Mg/Co/Ni transporter MgtE
LLESELTSLSLPGPTVIRGLAVGSIDNSNVKKFLKREFLGGALLSLILGVAGCIRAAVFFTPFLETFAITTSLFMIVFISVIFGALLPLGMDRLGIDPAHSSTTIQVIMDILGVAITVHVCSLVLDGGLSDWLKQSVMDGR